MKKLNNSILKISTWLSTNRQNEHYFIITMHYEYVSESVQRSCTLLKNVFKDGQISHRNVLLMNYNIVRPEFFL